MGIDKFFIIDNQSDDGTTELLQHLDSAGLLTFSSYRTRDVAPQLPAYAETMERIANEADWFLFIDADEFVLPIDGSTDLRNWFSKIDKEAGVGAVAINWAVYGSSGHITHSAGLVTERFQFRARQEFRVNCHYKTMIRREAYAGIGGNPHHFPLATDFRYISIDGSDLILGNSGGGISETAIWGGVRINHYVVKSRAEFFLKKRARGRASTLKPDALRTIKFFHGHDKNEELDPIHGEISSRLSNEIEYVLMRLSTTGFQPEPQKLNSPVVSLTPGIGCRRIESLVLHNDTITLDAYCENIFTEHVLIKIIINHCAAFTIEVGSPRSNWRHHALVDEKGLHVKIALPTRYVKNYSESDLDCQAFMQGPDGYLLFELASDALKDHRAALSSDTEKVGYVNRFVNHLKGMK